MVKVYVSIYNTRPIQLQSDFIFHFFSVVIAEVGVDKEKLVNDFKTRLLQVWEKANASLQRVANNEEDKCTEKEEEEDSYNEDVNNLKN